MSENNSLVWVDYVIIVITLLVSSGIGFHYKFRECRQISAKEYFTVAGSMNAFPVGLALMAVTISPITTLGLASEIYTYGTQFFVYIFGFLIAIPLVGYLYIPVFYKLQGPSMYMYLEKRFGLTIRLIASIINFCYLTFYSGIVLFSPALALETTSGIPKNITIFVIGIVSAIYSSIGGIKAVLVTDILQGIIMIGGGIIILGITIPMFGGLNKIWTISEEGGRIQFDNFSLDPTERHTFFGDVILGIFMFISTNVNQVQIQRFLSVKNIGAARSAIFISWISIFLIYFVTCLMGLTIYTAYKDCDPLENEISQMDILYPLFVMDSLSHLPGIPGLFIAGVFSDSLSTISAASNSLAAIFLEDYLKPLHKKCMKKDFPIPRELIIGKVLTFMVGIVIIGMAFIAQYLGGILQAYSTISASTNGIIIGLFTLGMLFESATESGGIIGIFTSLAFCTWMATGQPRPTSSPKLATSIPGYNTKNDVNISIINSTLNLPSNEKLQLKTGSEDSSYFYLYRISYVWYTPIGCVITILVGLIISNFTRIIFNAKQNQLDPDLFFPVIGDRIKLRRLMEGENNATEMETRL